MPSLHAYATLFRPVTLIPLMVITFMIGSMGMHYQYTADRVLHLLLAGALMVVANGASNIINEVADQKEDAAHPVKRFRPVVSGQFNATTVLSAAVLAWLAGIFIAAELLPPVFTALYAAIMVFAWIYSFPPRLKARFPFNYASIATPRGGLGIAAAWSIYGSFSAPQLWQILFITVPYVLLANESRNIDDAPSDRMAGIRTVSNIWGEKWGRIVTSAGFLWIPASGLVLASVRSPVISPWFLLAAVPAVFLAWGGSKAAGPVLWKGFYLLYLVLSLSLYLHFYIISI